MDVRIIFHSPLDKVMKMSFLRNESYYRRFIKGLSKIVAPMFSLMTKYVEFEWTNECQQPFDCIKDKLLTSPIL